jgi:hypothetical protein
MRDLSAAQSSALEATLVRLTAAAKDPPCPGVPPTAGEILQRIVARPWRRSAVDPATAADMAAKVQRAVAVHPAGVRMSFTGGRAAVLEPLQAREACQPPPADAELQRARRNLVWGDGSRDAEPPPEILVRQSARRCTVLMGLESRRAFNKYGPRLQPTHVRGADVSLHIGSCRSAMAQPWVSRGFYQRCPQRQEWIERMATGRAAWG